MQAAKKKEYLGDHLDLKASQTIREFLHNPDVIDRVDKVLSGASALTAESTLLVRRYVIIIYTGERKHHI